MGSKKIRLYSLLTALVFLAACSPQTVRSGSPAGPDTGQTLELDRPQLEHTSPPAGTPAKLGTPLQPAYPAENEPKTGNGVVRGSVEIVESAVMVTKNPLQVELTIKGNMPTPCHMLAWNIRPASRGAIHIEVYAEVDPEVICIQVLEPFDVEIELARLLPGDYTVWVNGEQAGDFQLDARVGYP